MAPWERRLRDLSNLLRECGRTYFSPDRFRQSLNQFLQTSRTVTFIIQKHKASIPDFESWYQAIVVDPWSQDTIMSWAKNSRNKIEKEGDLEMYSTLETALVFSYLKSQDRIVHTTKAELLRANVEKLLRFASLYLPPGVAYDAVLRIERRWVANSLPEYELLAAMTYVYGRSFDVALSLASHLQTDLDDTIPHPSSLDPTMSDARQTRYFRLREGGSLRYTSHPVTLDLEDFPSSQEFAPFKDGFASLKSSTNISEAVRAFAGMAEATFKRFGNHEPMLFLLGDNWNVVDHFGTHFRDQAEKFIFWRHAAERAAYLRAFAAIWISEAWLRKMAEADLRPIHELPIEGERLNVTGVCATGEASVASWNIERSDEQIVPKLVPTELPNDPVNEGDIFFLVPILESMREARGLSPASLPIKASAPPPAPS